MLDSHSMLQWSGKPSVTDSCLKHSTQKGYDMKHVNMDLPMSSILPAQLIIEGRWQHNKPETAACCGRVLLSRLPYFLPVVVDLVYLFWMATYCYFFFTLADYEEMELLNNWGQRTLLNSFHHWYQGCDAVPLNKETFITPTEKTVKMRINW